MTEFVHKLLLNNACANGFDAGFTRPKPSNTSVGCKDDGVYKGGQDHRVSV